LRTPTTFTSTASRRERPRGGDDLGKGDLGKISNYVSAQRYTQHSPRVADIVEHWDAIEEIAPKEQWANSGKF